MRLLLNDVGIEIKRHCAYHLHEQQWTFYSPNATIQEANGQSRKSKRPERRAEWVAVSS